MNPNLLEISKETIELTKAVYADGIKKAGISVAGQNLVGYNLEAPSKKVFPVLSPLRNRIPRIKAAVGSSAVTWKRITGINTNNLEGSVAFGVRNSAITYATDEKTASYKTFGMEDTVEHEAVWLGRGFEEVRALSTLSVMQSTMIEEEKIILGACGLSNGPAAPGNPTVTVSETGGSLAAATYYVSVVALPLYGYLNSDKSAFASISRHSDKNAAAQTGVIAGSTGTLSAVVAAVDGAVAYGWFVGTSSGAGQVLEAITTINSVKLTSVLGTGVSLSTITASTAADTNAMNGILPQLYASGSGALVVTQANGTAGTGTGLTSDAAGGIEEFDLILQQLWELRRISPTLILCNSQEAIAITKKVGGANPTSYRVNLSDGQNNIVGGLYVNSYLNKFAATISEQSGFPVPQTIPIMVHPFLPPGTIMFLSERLPYPNANVSSVFEMDMQQEYADFEWPPSGRNYAHGVYANGALKCYFPSGCAIIRNVGRDSAPAGTVTVK